MDEAPSLRIDRLLDEAIAFVDPDDSLRILRPLLEEGQGVALVETLIQRLGKEADPDDRAGLLDLFYFLHIAPSASWGENPAEVRAEMLVPWQPLASSTLEALLLTALAENDGTVLDGYAAILDCLRGLERFHPEHIRLFALACQHIVHRGTSYSYSRLKSHIPTRA